ncbi:E3 ubiquitin-protein ligase SINA-like 10 [Bienertia sinuspersici]
MAKFSMLRDHEEDEEDVCIRSPKRRRTYTPQTSSTSNQQQQSSSEDDDSIVAPTRSGESISVILSDPDVLDCAICFNPLTIPVFQNFSSMSALHAVPAIALVLKEHVQHYGLLSFLCTQTILKCSLDWYDKSPSVLDSISFSNPSILVIGGLPIFEVHSGLISELGSFRLVRQRACSMLFMLPQSRQQMPSCCGKIGNNRCRAIEKVIESVRVSCCYSRYGCKETISYCKKHEHEENCSYAPCSCPFPDCLFRGSPRRLASHICKEHDDLVKRFRYNSLFSVFLGMDEEILVLLEEREGTLFILNHGNTTAIRCIDPNLSSGRFAYDLVSKGGGTSLKFQSFTHHITGKFNDPPSVDYVLVPLYFYHGGAPNGQVKVEICIWDASHASSGCRYLTKLRS